LADPGHRRQARRMGLMQEPLREASAPRRVSLPVPHVATAQARAVAVATVVSVEGTRGIAMIVVATRMLGALAAAFAAFEAAAQQLAIDMKLEDAGFIMRRATTPDHIARLRQLPPHKFVARMGPSGRYYVYADADVCQCAFVGTERALQTYRDMRAKLPQPDNVGAGGFSIEHQIVHDMVNDGVGEPGSDIIDYRF
jgi:hypothetical protein